MATLYSAQQTKLFFGRPRRVLYPARNVRLKTCKSVRKSHLWTSSQIMLTVRHVKRISECSSGSRCWSRGLYSFYSSYNMASSSRTLRLTFNHHQQYLSLLLNPSRRTLHICSGCNHLTLKGLSTVLPKLDRPSKNFL